MERIFFVALFFLANTENDEGRLCNTIANALINFFRVARNDDARIVSHLRLVFDVSVTSWPDTPQIHGTNVGINPIRFRAVSFQIDSDCDDSAGA